MWRGSVERIPQPLRLRACVEGRSARRYVIFIFSRSRRRARDKEGHRYAEMSKKGVSVHFEIFAAPGRSLPAKVSKRSLTLSNKIFAQSPGGRQPQGQVWGDRARSAPLTVTPLGARTGRFPSKIVSMHAHHDHAACPCTGTQCTAYVVHRCALRLYTVR